MWNSPQHTSERGKRYTRHELAALIYPIDTLLALLESTPVTEAVDEPMLRRMEKGEFIYSLYEVFQALLEDVPVPEEGHPGYQEAMIVELLNQTLGSVEVELDDDDFGDIARRAAWDSIRLLLAPQNENSESNQELLDDLVIDLNDPRGGHSENLTREVWRDLLGANGLGNEFLWDHDWRTDNMMDADPAIAEPIARSAGIDLETAHRLPHTPTDAEMRMAEHYLKYLSWRFEAENPNAPTDR